MEDIQQQSVHVSVLLHESIDGLNITPGDVYLDGTLGGAGHAEYAARKAIGLTADQQMGRSAEQGFAIMIVGLDQDAEAIARAKERLEPLEPVGAKIILMQQNYRNLDKALDSIQQDMGVTRIMLDLGLSSDQFETSGRGFSFKKDEPLLMTFKKEAAPEDITAWKIVNTWEEENIADIIYGYGEERYSRKIARGIAEARSKKPINTTFDLVRVIEESTPGRYHHGPIHPATRTFQALRIAVNDELNTLKEGLAKGWERLTANSAHIPDASGKPRDEVKGRMAVISFHSLEDRIVKQFFKSKERNEAGERAAKILTKKPITASDQEISENPRSRSAKLRIIEKL